MGCGEGPRLSQRAILSRTITNEKEKKNREKTGEPITFPHQKGKGAGSNKPSTPWD